MFHQKSSWSPNKNYIYISLQLRMVPQKTVAGEAQRFSGIWLAAIQTDTALQYLAQLYSLFSLDKNDYDGSRFCLHEYKWFHLHVYIYNVYMYISYVCMIYVMYIYVCICIYIYACVMYIYNVYVMYICNVYIHKYI
jgi:hypothetical protein